MCGIVGTVNWGNPALFDRMIDLQAHRGPDGRGAWHHTQPDGKTIYLGSRRLAIVDLSPAGHMPMTTPDGAATITYNGEIYNYHELRRELESHGYSFRSTSDTEVVLNMYHWLGPDAIRRLNGMFALAIWDHRSERLFIARDHFGIKPLYYLQQGERFAFGSEIKSILLLPGAPREIDDEALQQYLAFLWVPDPLTMFRGIFKLPAGHHAIFQHGRLDITKYWDLEFPPADYHYPADEETLVGEIRQRFDAAVASQLRSDVPLGAFLSAGLDSSSIVASMARRSPIPVRTFTITFPEKYRKGETTIDDPDVARRTAAHFGCQHREIMVEPDVVSLLPKLIWHMDEPVADPAIITAHLVCREARKDVTVLLSGVGGDELFAGYRKHRAHFLAANYQRVPRPLRRFLIEPAIQSLPAMRGSWLKGYVRLAKKMVRSGSLLPEDRFILDSVYITSSQREELCSADTLRRFGRRDPRSRHLDYFAAVKDADFLNRMLYLDTKAFMASLNLTYNDKMSMANSVEIRVPFLDWPFVQWVAANVPPRLKLRGNRLKHIFRAAMRDVLPDEVLRQRKAGFGAPADYWLANDLREMVDDLLNPSQVAQRGLFRPAAVQQLIEQQRTGRHDWSMQLWQLLTLELWQRTFLDAVPAAVL
ncbi:MAG TPA: asparagine synthase (glutamine-hydrolyzing) [Pirellulales bacterium]|jgi:asparagine synthase (glutamine-hydrolysing)